MATKKTVTRSSATPKAPAQVLREQTAKIQEINASAPPPPPMSTERHPASDAAEAVGEARAAIRDLAVPVTLGEVCALIGTDVDPADFASTAFESIGDQISTLATLVETDASHDSWRLFRNLSERAKLAGRVAAWLAAEPSEVQP
jgi:hypothetical protein